MPWTFAHPAAVLPLRRWCPRRLSFFGLVIGSASPDFGYHLHCFDTATFAHTLGGLFAVCLPSGLLLAALLRRFGRQLLQPLPRRHREALAPLAASEWPRGWRGWSVLTASVGLGALTHIAWDSFTHVGGWAVQQWPALQATVAWPGAHAQPVFKWLQHGSSLLGAAALALAYGRWLRAQPAASADGRSDVFRTTALLVGAGALSLALAYARVSGEGTVTPAAWVFRAAVDGATLFMGLYVLAAVWLTRRPSASPDGA